jgi:WhiB family redox-sensing transcriptional regulator
MTYDGLCRTLTPAGKCRLKGSHGGDHAVPIGDDQWRWFKRTTLKELSGPPTHRDVALEGTPLCAETDPELWFPELGQSNTPAKRICMSCDLRAACLEIALANDEQFGIWGGLSTNERRALKRGEAA